MTKHEHLKVGALSFGGGVLLLCALLYVPDLMNALAAISGVMFFAQAMWVLSGIGIVGGLYELLLSVHASQTSTETVITPIQTEPIHQGAAKEGEEKNVPVRMENVVLGVSVLLAIAQIAFTVFGIVMVITILCLVMWAMNSTNGGGQEYLMAMYVLDGLVIVVGIGVAVFTVMTVGKEMR